MIIYVLGYVSLLMINLDLYDDSNFFYKQKKVIIVLLIGCYIVQELYGMLFYGIENMIVICGFYDEFKMGIIVNNILWI